jgi:hypothetical protein
MQVPDLGITLLLVLLTNLHTQSSNYLIYVVQKFNLIFAANQRSAIMLFILVIEVE